MDTMVLDTILEKWESDPDHLIMMLQDVQDEFHYLPREAMQYIADTLQVPLGRLYHISTFFKAFSLEPKGECIIQVCMGTACVVSGAERVLDAFSRELDLAPGETSADGRFSLEGVRCLGCCSLAPVVTINEDLYGKVKISDVPKLVKTYKEKGPAHAEA
ncbi:NAD(P)H-dependent oxidoreductase subunit E [bacterium]|nr:NAD(P)H-dependent oxidoreductase subunit E [candidate division CSSED10-310 bacterium]